MTEHIDTPEDLKSALNDVRLALAETNVFGEAYEEAQSALEQAYQYASEHRWEQAQDWMELAKEAAGLDS